MNEYHYNCVDESASLPILKRYVFAPLHKLVPLGIPANFLTLFSGILVWGSFIGFLVTKELSAGHILSGASAVWGYVVFDHFDGMQAKATSTSSPLGEILDHYSDFFNGLIVIYLGFRVLEIELGALFLVMIWLNCLAFAVTYVEQQIRKQLYFGPIGSLEGVILVIAVMLSCASASGLQFWQTPILLGQPAYLLIIGGFAAGCFFTVFSSFQRLGALPRNFIEFTLTGSLLLGVCLYVRLHWAIPFLVVSFYAGDFILKSMQGVFFDRIQPLPDRFAGPVVLAVLPCTFFELDYEVVLLAYGSYLLLQILPRGTHILTTFKEYWVWWNHPT
ncbi:MAG: CDP-alcohol phosphatidyltransferase family protein [SAR324 cluster bacterium]|nr:CDP-alcohol phosphatidyltransferase family protein [SAR324 cluster bacterium]